MNCCAPVFPRPRLPLRLTSSKTIICVSAGFGILAMAVFFYVLLDGFDLGVGMLFGFAPDTTSRNTIMNSIAPIWDGNETWLVFGGLGLLAAVPLAFAIIIPATYFPILVMTGGYFPCLRSDLRHHSSDRGQLPTRY